MSGEKASSNEVWVSYFGDMLPRPRHQTWDGRHTAPMISTCSRCGNALVDHTDALCSETLFAQLAQARQVIEGSRHCEQHAHFSGGCPCNCHDVVEKGKPHD